MDRKVMKKMDRKGWKERNDMDGRFGQEGIVEMERVERNGMIKIEWLEELGRNGRGWIGGCKEGRWGLSGECKEELRVWTGGMIFQEWEVYIVVQGDPQIIRL